MSKPSFNCVVCGGEFSRYPSQVRRGAAKTCSKACLGVSFAGKGNPFWGKSHTDGAKARIAESRKGKAAGNQNAEGHKHTEEQREKIAGASRQMWQEQRDQMLASLPRGENHHFHKPPEERRHRKRFSPRQRRELLAGSCAYCGSIEKLVLDHIIPVFDGGTNDDFNAQTLCRPCNIWKVYAIDLPRRDVTHELAKTHAVNCWDISDGDNQQPSLGGNALEGSTTRGRGCGESHAGNTPTSAVPGVEPASPSGVI